MLFSFFHVIMKLPHKLNKTAYRSRIFILVKMQTSFLASPMSSQSLCGSKSKSCVFRCVLLRLHALFIFAKITTLLMKIYKRRTYMLWFKKKTPEFHAAKCPICNGNLELDTSMEIAFCKDCGAQCIVENLKQNKKKATHVRCLVICL